MRGKLAKKLRREVHKSEVGIAEKAAHDFKLFVRTLPFRARLILSYKILRGILCLFLIIGAPAQTEASTLSGFATSEGEAPSFVDWKGVVVHISDSDQMTPDQCDEWHSARGWDGCGYNFVVEPDGAIYEARGWNKVGAHVKGHNSKYLGFCFVSKDAATPEQLASFRAWLAQAEGLFGFTDKDVFPHRHFNNGKRCPGAVWEQLLKEKQDGLAR